jgi:hypothetical protein
MKKFLCTLLLAAALPAFAQERFASRPVRLGAEIEGGGPQRLDEFLRAPAEKWGAVIKATGASGR